MSTMRVTTLKNEASSVDQIVLNADGSFGGELNDALSSKLDSTAYQPGLVLIDSESFSAVSSVSVDNCFTSTYDNYRIICDFTNSNAAYVLWRLRASGSDNTTSNYGFQELQAASSTVIAGRTSSATGAELAYANAQRGMVSADFYAPALAKATGMTGLVNRNEASQVIQIYSGWHGVATAFDGITFYPAAGTFSGTLKIYGYRN